MSKSPTPQEKMSETSSGSDQEPSFQIQRIYAKDISFEAPNVPQIFQKEWAPEVKMDLNTASKPLGDETYEVILRVTVTTQAAEETIFLCEVQQAGIFTLSGLNEEQTTHCLATYCPNILFPYARECISSLVMRGTFPHLHLAPVNFDALFMQYLQEQKNTEDGSGKDQ